MSLVVGMTGGIGSGKSAAAAAFAALGAAIVDTDAIAHRLTAAGGAAIGPLCAAFGSGILTPTGALDRTAMRERVFADPAQRKRLENILHPLIRHESAAEVHRAASADFPYVVLVVPLLVESASYRERVDRILVIDCPQEIQIARVMARNGLSRPEVEAILAAQATREARLALADDVLDNAGAPENLHSQVTELHRKYLEIAPTSGELRESSQ